MSPTLDSEIVINGPDGESVAPADAIIRLLSGLQQVSLAFAASNEGRSIGQRFRVPATFKAKYTLVCGTPTLGSYHLPVGLVDVSAESASTNPGKVLEQVKEFVKAIAEDDEARAKQILPDSKYREYALREIRSFAPKVGDRWKASLTVGKDASVSLNGKVARNIEKWLDSTLSSQAQMTVIGELVGINFDEHRLSIKIPIDNRQLDCIYLPEIEVDLLESRRDLIQVTGEFTVDVQGHPQRITSASRIDPVDLSPIVLKILGDDKYALAAKRRFELTPTLDPETQQRFLVDDAELGLCVVASTRSELIEEIVEQILCDWSEYADASDDTLTAGARRLAQTLRDRFQRLTDDER
jgi:hypothetical protein